jgi:hypothetical protein
MSEKSRSIPAWLWLLAVMGMLLLLSVPMFLIGLFGMVVDAGETADVWGTKWGTLARWSPFVGAAGLISIMVLSVSLACRLISRRVGGRNRPSR